jgi:ribosomal protein S26
MVDASSKRDIQESYAYNFGDFQMPKIYVKLAHCISSAIQARIVRIRRVEDRVERYTTKLRHHLHPGNQTANASLPLTQLPRKVAQHDLTY